MLYHLFDFLKNEFDLTGAGLFQYITFRALLAAAGSLLIGILFGKKIIGYLQKQQIGETIRDLGLEGQMQKKGTPTMGGLIIILSILAPVLLFARLDNVYVQLLITSTVWMGIIGFLDDYIKVIRKDKEGLKGKFKVVGQVGLGLLIGLTLSFHPDVKLKKKDLNNPIVTTAENGAKTVSYNYIDEQNSLEATIPFLKNNEFNYKSLTGFLPDWTTVVLYIFVVIFIVTAVSNGANITDGLDGLAAGISAIIGVALAVLAYVSGHIEMAEYLNIMAIPNSGEVVIFATAFVGACIGFLWYNAFPAQVFMGDTGSLSLGAVIAVMALVIRKEFLIPILCGVFLIENLSVMIQVGYFKYTKKKYGEGRRVFKMAPLHHHYQKSNIPESKIVTRFWITGILLAILTIATLKIR